MTVILSAGRPPRRHRQKPESQSATASGASSASTVPGDEASHERGRGRRSRRRRCPAVSARSAACRGRADSTSSFGNRCVLKPSTSTRSTGSSRASSSGECRFVAGDLVQQRPAAGAGHQHLMRAGLAVAMAVLAGPVHVEAVMRVLDGGDTQAVARAAAAAGRRAAWSCRCRTSRPGRVPASALLPGCHGRVRRDGRQMRLVAWRRPAVR